MASDEFPSRLEWLRSVLDEFEGPLARYAARLTGDVDRARDIVQETFLRLCKEPRPKVEGRLAQWLFAVCRSRALDAKRKESRMSTITIGQNESCASKEPAAASATSPAALSDGRPWNLCGRPSIVVLNAMYSPLRP